MNFARFLRKRNIVIATCCLCVCMAAFFYKSYVLTDQMDREAQRVVATCASAQLQLRENCYERTVPSLYPKFSVSDLFVILADIQTRDPQYTSCHVAAHAVGARVADENPDHWMDAVHLNPPDSPCDGGYLHGLLSERFNAEVLSPATIQGLIPAFKHVCEPTDTWHPAALEEYLCYHGMGHLYVFITNADMPRALELCKETVPALFTQEGPRLCYNGAFMEILTPTGPDGFVLQKQLKVDVTKDSVKTYCRTFQVDPMQYGTCLQRGMILYQPPLTSGQQIDSYCADEPDSDEHHYCLVRGFKNLGFYLSLYARQDSTVCDGAPASERQLCYNTVSLILLKEDNGLGNAHHAIAFCDSISDTNSSAACAQSLAAHGAYFYGPNSESFNQFCSLFSGSLKETCVSSPVGTYF